MDGNVRKLLNFLPFVCSAWSRCILRFLRVWTPATRTRGRRSPGRSVGGGALFIRCCGNWKGVIREHRRLSLNEAAQRGESRNDKHGPSLERQTPSFSSELAEKWRDVCSCAARRRRAVAGAAFLLTFSFCDLSLCLGWRTRREFKKKKAGGVNGRFFRVRLLPPPPLFFFNGLGVAVHSFLKSNEWGGLEKETES